MAQYALPRDVLTFVVGETHYGIDILKIKNVFSLPQPLRLAGDLCCGQLSVEGESMPVLDRRKQSSASVCSMSEPVKVLVLTGDGHQFAMAVDRVADLVRLYPTWIEPAKDEDCMMGTRFIVETDEQSPRLSLICVDRLLERAKMGGWKFSAAA